MIEVRVENKRMDREPGSVPRFRCEVVGYVDGEEVYKAPVTHRMDVAADSQETLQAYIDQMKGQVRTVCEKMSSIDIDALG